MEESGGDGEEVGGGGMGMSGKRRDAVATSREEASIGQRWKGREEVITRMEEPG